MEKQLKKRKAQEEDTSKPSAVQMLQGQGSGRKTTVSVALPASIIDNCQSGELKAILVGQIARALTIYGVNEIVLFEDRSDAPKSNEDGVSKAMAFFARNLQYLETPQYLRRQLLPVHKDLKWVGVLAPLDAPHHLRKSEHLQYREGVVLKKDDAPQPPASEGDSGKKNAGCWVYCGLDEPVWVEGEEIEGDVRVTVRLEDASGDGSSGRGNGGKGGSGGRGRGAQSRRGVAVSPREPTIKQGIYWGYQLRLATGLKAVFEECPFEGGYDLTIGTSERGDSLGSDRLPRFKHLLLAFGGLGGFEEVLADKMSGYSKAPEPSSLFDRYINICPRQTSRTIRTEEALLIALASLEPLMPQT
eukprot:TRINITY_DN9215_c7_g1_i1.p1 TRINITY_DN9215_c7_g1~~TRINITY_DN9215_c7_g1_i1.p1  ORF type:complete len:359 (+),score=56.12 TRINITY_DN9215_c7_g1_i1:45-1121(+)